MLIVVALGGNAVSPPGQEGNIPQQYASTRRAVQPLANLLLAGRRLAITHGNGPQVGNVMRRVEIAAQHHVYPLPLDTVVADTQAGMGYMIGQCLMNELASRGRPRVCSTIITTVCVDGDDPAFANPTKPVGPVLTREQAGQHASRDGWKVVQDAAGGWRRVVPSPWPREIVEMATIARLVEMGETVIAAGGGGIPVVRDAQGRYSGVEAVIDKDRTSALLAVGIGADVLAFVTGVAYVHRGFGTPDASPIERLTVRQARAMLEAGQFSAGSMGPKIEAAVEFIERSGRADAQAVITSCEQVEAALGGVGGTRVVRE